MQNAINVPLPTYWVGMENPQLHQAVKDLFRADSLTTEQLDLLKAYCRDWVNYPGWVIPLPSHPGASAREQWLESLEQCQDNTSLLTWFQGLNASTAIDPM